MPGVEGGQWVHLLHPKNRGQSGAKLRQMDVGTPCGHEQGGTAASAHGLAREDPRDKMLPAEARWQVTREPQAQPFLKPRPPGKRAQSPESSAAQGYLRIGRK